MCRRITQQALGLTYIGLAVAHVARAEVTVHRLFPLQVRVKRQQVAVQLGIQLVEGSTVAYGYVVDLVDGGDGLRVVARNDRGGGCRRGGQQVGLHHILNKAEVAASFTVAVDVDRLALDEAGNPLGNDGSIRAVGVLSGAKYVEVAQAHGVEAVAAGKHVGIQLVDVFSNGVGAEGFANGVFYLGQAGVVAVGGTAGSVGEAFDLGVASGC